MQKKPGLHPRNRHATRYNFNELSSCLPELKKYISKNNKSLEDSIDFSNPDAVISLNRALLKFFYKIDHWDIPQNYLCPPIPGRADYIHQAADLLASFNGGVIPKGRQIQVLDVGVGANCVYPLIASFDYQWQFVGSDIDALALENANKIISKNKLEDKIALRHQLNNRAILNGIIEEQDFFDLIISNPPFHKSQADAMAGSMQKNKNLGTKRKGALKLNFGGKNNELWCEGGEEAFIARMINESLQFKKHCFWFTTLVSKAENLPALYLELKKANVRDFKTIDMAQGQKKSRILAWTFFSEAEQKEWRSKKN